MSDPESMTSIYEAEARKESDDRELSRRKVEALEKIAVSLERIATADEWCVDMGIAHMKDRMHHAEIIDSIERAANIRKNL